METLSTEQALDILDTMIFNIAQANSPNDWRAKEDTPKMLVNLPVPYATQHALKDIYLAVNKHAKEHKIESLTHADIETAIFADIMYYGIMLRIMLMALRAKCGTASMNPFLSEIEELLRKRLDED